MSKSHREFSGGLLDSKTILEALLFSADRPLSVANLQSCFADSARPEKGEIRAALKALSADYEDRSLELTEVANGFWFQVRQEYSLWVAKLLEDKPPRYSRALLETLAIIVYRQPATRGTIEEIRGVSVSSTIIRTLLDRGWIKVVGHKEVPGRPALFATTRQFLDDFNLRTLDSLPSLSEIEAMGSESDSDTEQALERVPLEGLELAEESQETNDNI